MALGDEILEALFEQVQENIRMSLHDPQMSATREGEKKMLHWLECVRMNFGKLDTLCIRVLAERMKAKKARRP